MDWDTNTAAPAKKDGYGPGILLGYVASQPFSGAAPGSAPLFGYFNPKLRDNLCGPFSSEKDVNRIVPGKSGWVRYNRDAGKPALLGFMAKGSCDVCSTSVARTFGNAGGPGCQASCRTGRTFMGLVWDMGAVEAGLKPFQDMVGQATATLPLFGSIDVTARSGLHMAFAYFCCLTKQEAAIVKAAAVDNCGAGWPDLSLQFGFSVYEFNKVGGYSVTAELTPQNQTRMQAMIKAFELCIQKRGVVVRVPRANQWPFHVTIGSVKAEDVFAGGFATAAINKLNWTSARASLSSKPPKCTGSLC